MQTTYDFDYLVFIGRFQPFHLGHLKVVQQGLLRAERMILLCGSARQPRDIRNPWTIAEVEAMIHAACGEALASRVVLEPLMDHLYNECRWIKSVQNAVRAVVSRNDQSHTDLRIGLIGLNQTGENYYPSLFPQWESIGVDEEGAIRGTRIRDALFGVDDKDIPQGIAYLASDRATKELPAPVRKQLVTYCSTDACQAIHTEARFISRYRQAWKNAPYPPTFVTVDAIVIQSGHVLMVERRAQPGKGLHALPGGFLRGDEFLEDACIRELREETRLKVPSPVLKGSIRGRRVFDAPYRSQRGRTITHAFLIELIANPTLPKVKGGDDARYAFWVPLAELTPENIFEDHYFIIQAMIG